MNDTPLVSVVMPVYNAEKYLIEAIESILNQTYKNFEFIIINDGSTDKSLDILNKYKKEDNRIIIISRKNKGLIASLNEGIEKAKGKYITRMDADDVSLPNRLEEQIKLMEDNKLDICGCHFFNINEFGHYTDATIVPLTYDSFLYFLSITVPFAHPSVMIRKDFMIENKLFYGKTVYKDAEDYILWVEFWRKNAKFGNVNKFLFKYRHYSISLSKSNKLRIASDTNLISKQFILDFKHNISSSLHKNNLAKLTEKEQKIVIVLLFCLIKYDFSLGYFKKIKHFNKRTVICGFLRFLKNNLWVKN